MDGEPQLFQKRHGGQKTGQKLQCFSLKCLIFLLMEKEIELDLPVITAFPDFIFELRIGTGRRQGETYGWVAGKLNPVFAPIFNEGDVARRTP